MTMHIPRTRTWAIILAGGDGTRLARLTQAIHGRPTPKQFATLVGGRSLLQATLTRLEHVVPRHRLVVVVGRPHLPWARVQLRDHADVNVLVQPASRGTATAILYALRWIRLQAPDAQVLVSPSDHHIDQLSPFLAAIDAGIDASQTLGRLVLLGVKPTEPDPDYGWIVGGASQDPTCSAVGVERFVEKPSAELAAKLFHLGALWNTFLFTAPAAVLVELARAHLPEHARRFDELDRLAFVPGTADVETLFGALEAADYSRQVLQAAAGLSVVAMPDTGWSDWGTPARVLTSLRGTVDGAALRRHLDECDRRGALVPDMVTP